MLMMIGNLIISSNTHTHTCPSEMIIISMRLPGQACKLSEQVSFARKLVVFLYERAIIDKWRASERASFGLEVEVFSVFNVMCRFSMSLVWVANFVFLVRQ